MGGGITKLKRNAFTLIELLAIIVILAIIAVITVPIILNIIENSRKGAATDSAYGFKDAVNKYYVTELSDNNSLMLNGKYDVSTGGVLDGSGISNKEIPVSGDKPSAGELHYTNNTIQGGCLVIGDYQVIFDGGSVSSTTKGNCSSYNFSSSENSEQSGSDNEGESESGQQAVVPTIDSCPGCVYAYTTEYWYYTGEDQTTLESKDFKEDYNDVMSETGKNNFFGLILDDDTKKITNVFSCGVENETPFCIEGTIDGSRDSDNRNLLVKIYGEYDETTGSGCINEGSDMYCYGSLSANSNSSGYVYVSGDGALCYVHDSGYAICDES